MHERTSWLAAMTVALTACISHETAPASDEPEPEPEASAMTVADRSPVSPAANLVFVSVAPDPACAPFRDPDATATERRQRSRYLRQKLAVQDANDPALAESLLWLAEFQLGSGHVSGACEALDRLTAEVTDGEYAETGRCWFDHHCAPDATIACPPGFAADGPEGCAPVATCALDLDTEVAPQLEGACQRGDAACCAKEGSLSQIYAHRARQDGDDQAERRYEKAAREAYEQSCAMGHASVCAAVASGSEREQDAEALRARACELGHVESCS